MMRMWKRFFSMACVGLFFVSLSASSSQSAETEMWLLGTFKEVHSASPVIGSATMPLVLAKALVAAVPPKFIKETMEEGFDIQAIAAAVEQMGINEKFEMTQKDYYLSIRKFTRSIPAEKTYPNRLVISNPTLSLPIPLIMTGAAVKLLQMAYTVFENMDDQLRNLIEQIKLTPPGLLLKGEDKLMDSWLEIDLR